MGTRPSSSEAALIIDGRAIAAAVRRQVAETVASFASEGRGRPGLATILIGDDPASRAYVASKHEACSEAAIESFHHHLRADVAREDVLELVDRLNDDDSVSGILCQLPLPDHLDPEEVTDRIRPEKDVDGLTIASAGRLALAMPGLRPCTPAGVMLLLEHVGVEWCGKQAVVIGRSNLFGKPMAQLLLSADATVTVCQPHRQAHRRLLSRRRPDCRRWAGGDGTGRLGQARCGGHRRGHQQNSIGAGRGRRLRGGGCRRIGDHAGARRRRPDDDCLSAEEHGRSGRRHGPPSPSARPCSLGEAIRLVWPSRRECARETMP
jgi:5,10-methylene-tetrahydrofolate dehydrogenase/methenyl tetrahydrofolate cyclohydrolase